MRSRPRLKRSRRTTYGMLAAAFAGVLIFCGQSPTWAQPARSALGLVVLGAGKQQRLDPTQFRPDMRVRYDLFATRCTKCHAMSRPIAALTTGITPVSGGTFDAPGIRRYVVRMMRKPNSGIDRNDARELIRFLTFTRQSVVAAQPKL